MKLLSLYVENFKNLKEFTINFEPQDNLSIIIGNNGSGKSNVLEALSAIFAELYSSSYYNCGFNYTIKYEEKNKIVEIKRYPHNYNHPTFGDMKSFKRQFIADGVTRAKKYLFDNYLVPSRVIALYSGEETRLYNHYYEKFTKQYLRDFSKTLQPSNNMIYIDKSYWNVALLVLAFSAFEGRIDHKEFIEHNLKIETIKQAEIFFNTSMCNNLIEGSPLKNLIKHINPELKHKKQYTGEEFFNYLSSFEHFPQDIFNILIHGAMLQRKKAINDIKFYFNEHNMTFSDLSEGEKKKLLTRTVIDLVADERSIIILDEPDSHIHIEGKQELFNMFKESSKQNRSLIITTHSPTLTNCAEDTHIIMLSKDENNCSQQITEEKINAISKLTGGIWSANERNIFLSSSKPLVLVEGKGDKEYIKAAIKTLDYDLNIEVLPVGGATNACHFIEEIHNVSTNKKIIMLFDRDEAGYKGLGTCISRGTNGGRADTNIYKKENIYYLMLPKTATHNHTDFLIEDYFPLKLKKRVAHAITKEGEGYFNKYTKDLKDRIKTDLAKPEYLTKSNLTEFSILLDNLQLIINDTAPNVVDI